MTAPTGHKLRVDSAIPWASQIRNDTGKGGNYVSDLFTNAGIRLRAQAVDLDLQTLDDEVSVQLGGKATEVWHPTFVIVKITAITGAANGDAQITIGTAAGGTQLLAATALTGLNAADESIMLSFSGTKAEIAANATLYVKCTTADTGAGTVLTADAYVYGEIL